MNQANLFMEQIKSNNEMIYEALPYVPHSAKRPLAMLLKMQELHQIASSYPSEDDLAACDLSQNRYNLEDVLHALRKKAHGSAAIQLDKILSMIQAEKMFRVYKETSQAGALDLSAMMQAMSKGDNNESEMA